MYNGFSYGGIHSSAYGISCDRETHSILPEQRKYVKEVPGLDGYIDYGIGGYGSRVISPDIYFDGDYADLRANREEIIAWLSNENGLPKQLIFDDEPDRYYMAKVYAALEFNNTSNRCIGAVSFECNPPWQYSNGILLTPSEISWITADGFERNQYIKTFTAAGSIRFKNTGTKPIKPTIKLIGKIPSGTKLTYGSAEWEYNAALEKDGIIIDCENETVTRMSDGANLFSWVNENKCDYFELQSGNCEMFVAASGIGSFPNDLTVIIEFNPTFAG